MLHVLSLALACSMLLTVAWRADRSLVFERLYQADGFCLLGLVLSYLATAWFRAARFRGLLEPGAAVADWFRLSVLHNFYFTFVPFKLGEASFLPLAGRREVPAAEAGLALLLARMFELTIVLAMGLVGMATLGLASAMTPALLALALGVFITFFYRQIASALIAALERLARFGLPAVLDSAVTAVGRGRAWLARHEERRRVALLQTIVICGLAGFSVFLAFCALGITLTASETLFVYAGLSALGLLGAFTVAGIGVSDMGLAGLLVLLGYPVAEAAALALAARLLLLSSALLGTGLALLYRGGTHA